jgi:hypothetical protein
LAAKSDPEVIREVCDRIDAALRKNHRTELVIIGVLLLLFLSGIGLIIFGAAVQRWEFLVPGGLAELAIVFPIRQLVKLRADNLRLQIIPQLLRLADTPQAKALAFELIQRLIRQV